MRAGLPAQAVRTPPHPNTPDSSREARRPPQFMFGQTSASPASSGTNAWSRSRWSSVREDAPDDQVIPISNLADVEIE